MIVDNRSRLWVTLIAAGLVIAAVAAGWLLFRADPTLLRNAQFSHSVITPNADQDTDATRVSYEITRNATVSIYFEDEAGQRYYFRQQEPRGVGEYEVLFSGVVDGYRLPGEVIAGQILSRLLRDGQYTWHITATDEDGLTETETGSLTIAEADPELPEVRDFTLDRHLFTPNQDGIDDRVLIQFFLTKEVEQTRVFLRTSDGSEVPIAEQERDVPPNSPGRHYYDYEGGVDNNATPPPDGTYPVVVIAADAEGQRVRVEDTLTIQFGGVPRAEIISPPTDDTVQFSATAVALCDSITFTLTVENWAGIQSPAPGAWPSATRMKSPTTPTAGQSAIEKIWSRLATTCTSCPVSERWSADLFASSALSESATRSRFGPV